MSYLGRIAARASAVPASVGLVGARPAAGAAVPGMVSRSPLVQFDQRLTLPGFADMAPVAPRAAIGDPTDGLAPPDGDGSPVASSPGAPTKPELDAPAPFSPARRTSLVVGPPPTTTLSDGFLADVLPSEAVSLAVPNVGRGADAPVRVPETRGRVQPTDSVEREMPAPSSPPPSEPSLGALEFSPPPPTPGVVVNGAVASAVPDVSRELTPARNVLDAMTRLDAWLRADAHEATGRAPEAAPAMSAPDASGAEPAPAPVISIGKLEIEVVPAQVSPARTFATSQARERRGRAAVRAPSPLATGGSRAFGWRQR